MKAAMKATLSPATSAKSAPDTPGPGARSPSLQGRRHLLARRAVQALVLLLFAAGPWWGWWVVKGNLSSSLTLGVLPLTDPFVLSQTVAAGLPSGRVASSAAWLGAALVVAFYALVGGRSFCSWVCPVNVATDAAGWLRRRLGIRTGRSPSRALRHSLLAAVLLVCAVTGAAVWESVNPVSLTQRALIFGGTGAFGAVAAVFVFDLLVAPRGWCAHLCPHGAFYGLVGRLSVLRVSAQASSRCNDCGDCYAVCPEPHVIPIALKGKEGTGPVIRDADCTNCGRCIDVCSTRVFRFTHRWNSRRI